MVPFFLIGNPRSGTTLLRLMLNSHSLITVPPECGFAVWLYDKYKNQSFANAETVNLFIEDVIQTRKFETWGVSKEEIKEFTFSRKHCCYSDIVSSIYYTYAQSRNKHPLLIGDKNNFYISEISRIKEIFSNPKIVFIVRDGRDVALSYRELHNKTIDSIYAPRLAYAIEDIANEWLINCNSIINESYPQSILITYESLVASPKETLTYVCSFLEIEYEETMLAYYLNTDEPKEFLQWKPKILERPDSSNINRFLSHMSTKEVALFESIACDMLKRMNYKLYREYYSYN
jgi:hypothetical protein